MKRKLQDSDDRRSKRFQPELFDSEDEEEMCRIADEVELWSGDEEWEEDMAQAVNDYELSVPKETLPVEQFGRGQPSSNQPQQDANQDPPDNHAHRPHGHRSQPRNRQTHDGDRPQSNGNQHSPDNHTHRPHGHHSQAVSRRSPNGDQPQQDIDHHPPDDQTHRPHGDRSQPVNRRPPNGDQPKQDVNHHPPDDHAHQPYNHPQLANPRPPNGDEPQPNVIHRYVNDDHPANARINSALNNTAETIRFTPRNNVDIPAAFHDVDPSMRAAIRRRLQQHRNIRGYLTSNVTFSRVHDGEVITPATLSVKNPRFFERNRD